MSGGIVTNDGALRLALAVAGAGLAYVDEPSAGAALASGAVVRVLEPYAVHVPGFFLYYPSRAQRSPALRLFVEMARELATVG